ncbi:MAG: flavodoxin family protein [Proteobacteria bacterium]|nr:flavodoxin family protein [Pseudomonadota bacterium]
MKKVLGIIGSPRKLGNCEIIVKEIASHIPVNHHLSLLRLSDFDIRLCRGCYQCLQGKGGCVIQDDFPLVAQAMAEADAYILAVPTYLLGPNASLKLLLDRALGFYHRVEDIWGKPAIGVVVTGMEGREGYSKLGVDSFLRLIMAEVKGSVVLSGALPGEVVREGNISTAKRLGAALFGYPFPAGSPTCPVCGGDTFRFLDRFSVRCMLCSNTGVLDVSSGKPAFLITRSDHEFFLTEKDAMDHRAWLESMKQRFLERRGALKKTTLAYVKQGDWIKPETVPPLKKAGDIE